MSIQRKWLHTVILGLIFAFLLAGVAMASESATCGENVTWTLDEGVLTINGTGEMDDYESYDPIPWNSYKTLITSVVVNDGVTRIGKHAFGFCSNLSEVSIADSVTSLGDQAFEACERLTEIELPERITSIGFGTFTTCHRLKRVPESVKLT